MRIGQDILDIQQLIDVETKLQLEIRFNHFLQRTITDHARVEFDKNGEPVPNKLCFATVNFLKPYCRSKDCCPIFIISHVFTRRFTLFENI